MRGLEYFLQTFEEVVETRFVMTVKSDNAGTSATNQFTIPIRGVGFNYTVETSDGYFATGLTTDHTITFPSGAGTHDVFISGDFPQVYFNAVGDRLKLLDVKNFGIYGGGTNDQFASFKGCEFTTISATDVGNFGDSPNFAQSFFDCKAIVSIPKIDVSSSTTFNAFFVRGNSLQNVPANMFDNCLATNFNNAFLLTNLTQASIDGILVSINSNATSNGTFFQSGGSAPSATGQTAIDALRARGWIVTVTGGY